jgi:hypothetical protein
MLVELKPDDLKELGVNNAQHVHQIQAYIDIFRSLLGKSEKLADATNGNGAVVAIPPIKGLGAKARRAESPTRRLPSSRSLSSLAAGVTPDNAHPRSNDQSLRAPRHKGAVAPASATHTDFSVGCMAAIEPVVAQPPALSNTTAPSGPPRAAVMRASRSMNGPPGAPQPIRRVLRQPQSDRTSPVEACVSRESAAGVPTVTPELSPPHDPSRPLCASELSPTQITPHDLTRSMSQQSLQSKVTEVSDSTFECYRRGTTGSTFSRSPTGRTASSRSASPGHYMGHVSTLETRCGATFGRCARNTTRSLLLWGGTTTHGHIGPGVGRYSPPPRKDVVIGGSWDRDKRFKSCDTGERAPGPMTYRPRVAVLSTFGKGVHH